MDMEDHFKGEIKPMSGLYKGGTEDSFTPNVEIIGKKTADNSERKPEIQFREKAETAAAGLGAALVVEAVETVAEHLKDARDSKKEESKKPEAKKETELDFTQIEDRLFGNQKLEEVKKKELENLRQQRIDEFKKLDGGRFAEDLGISVRKTLRKNDWDDVYDEVGQVGRNYESQLRGRAEIPDHLNGIVLSATRYESARILKAGLDKQSRDIGPQNMRNWVEDKKADQYNEDELRKLYYLAERSFIRLAPDAPEELVGKDIKKEENPPIKPVMFDTTALEEKIDRLAQLQTEQLASQRRMEQHQMLQQASQEEQVELMKRGYDGFIQILDSNAPMDPRSYKLNLPLWYNRESKEFRQCVDFMANANYIASVKRTCKGPSDVFELPLSLNTRDIEYMWANLPGFKEATATIISDIFDPNIKDRFVISGHPADVDKGIEATGGYKILESDSTIIEYKDRLAAKIGQVLDQRRVNLSERFRGVNNKDHATAAVSTIFNTLYGGGAFDSGDEQNKLNPGQPMAVTLSFRMLYMPGARGESKWLANRKPDKGVYEEDFGGPIGRFLRWNASHTPGYADKIRNGDVKYLPKRMLFSMFEHETFTAVEDGGKNRFAGKSLAEALITVSQEANSQGGIKIPTRGVGFDDIERGGDMFTSYVANAASYVLPIYDHLTSNDPKKRLAGEQAINLVMKCRKDERLRDIFYGTKEERKRGVSSAEDMITAIVGLAASPEGFETGTDKLLLKVSEVDYIPALRKVLNDNRWFEGMPRGFKERMILALNAPELLSNLRDFTMEFLPFLANTRVNPRQGIRAEIRKNAGII